MSRTRRKRIKALETAAMPEKRQRVFVERPAGIFETTDDGPQPRTADELAKAIADPYSDVRHIRVVVRPMSDIPGAIE